MGAKHSGSGIAVAQSRLLAAAMMSAKTIDQ